jgi:DNA-binding MarR family transcriptional regulator
MRERVPPGSAAPLHVSLCEGMNAMASPHDGLGQGEPPGGLSVGYARTLARLMKLLEDELVALGVTIQQFRALNLVNEDGVVASIVADRLAVTPSTVTSLMDPLVKHGLVRRRVDTKDRRRVLHQVTLRGQKLLDAAEDKATALLGQLLNDEASQAALVLALNALGQALDEAREGFLALDFTEATG